MSDSRPVPSLNYFALYPDVPLLMKATDRASCFDIQAYFGTHERQFRVYDENNAEMLYMAYQNREGEGYHVELNPGDRALIPTGLVLEIPAGYSVRVHPRSGLSLKRGLTLTNCEGVIDEDYTHQLYVSLTNISKKPCTIFHGDRIAQLEMIPTLEYSIHQVANAPGQRGNRIGGFGSSGQ